MFCAVLWVPNMIRFRAFTVQNRRFLNFRKSFCSCAGFGEKSGRYARKVHRQAIALDSLKNMVGAANANCEDL